MEPEADDEPKKLGLLLGVATVVAGVVIFFLWPRERAAVSETPTEKLFSGPKTFPEPRKPADPLPAPRAGGPSDMIRVVSSEIPGPVGALLQELKKEPALAAVIDAHEAQERAGDAPTKRSLFEKLNAQGAFGDTLRHAFADRGLAPVLAPLTNDPEVGDIVAAAKAEPTPAPKKKRQFRSDETIGGLVIREEGEAAPAGGAGKRTPQADKVVAQ
ncbi:MAG: hypothetical protein HY925_11920 [Elusimicrobia bacterium]|nr:hypothetical protein [Elusimicrobiota bacterium]